MKSIYTLSILSLFLFACKKEFKKTDDDSNAQKVQVTINVEGFSKSIGTITNSNKGVNGVVQNGFSQPADIHPNDKLIYIVYDSKGVQVSRLQQQVSDPDKLYRIADNTKVLVGSNNKFGSITDVLYPGDYTLIVMFGNSDASLNRFYDNQTSTDFPLAYPANPLSKATFYPMGTGFILGDSFLYKGKLSVTANSNMQTVTLNRIVGQLTFNIEDAIPSNAASFTYEITTENLYYSLESSIPAGSAGTNGHLTSTVKLTSSDNGKKNYTASTYILNTKTPLSVKLTFNDVSGNVIATKTIQNVTVNVNQKTTLTGKMFDNTSSNAFTININQVWGSNPTTIAIPPANSSANSVNINGIDYPTVTIGTQIWTAANYAGSGSIGSSPNHDYYYLHNDALKIIPPTGWRLPSKDDFNTLMSNFSTKKDKAGNYILDFAAAQSLMSKTGWSEDVNGTNTSGFNALPVGFYYSTQNWLTGVTEEAHFVTSSITGTLNSFGGIEPLTFNISNYSSDPSLPYAALEMDEFNIAGTSVRFVRDK